MVRRTLKHFVLLGTVLVFAACSQVWATQPASADVEVKFSVDPSKVLDAKQLPSEALRTTFQLAPKTIGIQMEFLDGSNASWRAKGGISAFARSRVRTMSN
jgi:hypothetical protein